MTIASPLTQGGPAGEPGRPLRLLMGPVSYRTTLRQAFPLQLDSRCRWVQELNGHPGQCSPDHWHPTPEEALACFRGER